MIPLARIESARARLAPWAVRTPLLRLRGPAADAAGAEIWLKPENLQPFSSFKIRPAAALYTSLDDAELERGGDDRERRELGAGGRVHGRPARRSLHGGGPR